MANGVINNNGVLIPQSAVPDLRHAIRVTKQLRGKDVPLPANQPKMNAYTGPFAVSRKNSTTVTVGAGRVIAGTAQNAKNATDVVIAGLTANPTRYVYVEIYYTTSWQIGFVESNSYPDQSDKSVSGTDYPCLRIELAEVTINTSDEVITGRIRQKWWGNIHVAGRLVE